MFPSPDFLSLTSRSALELLGTHVFVVGHPEASLKRWTEGTVVDTDGQWFKSTAFTLPGDSGSPRWTTKAISSGSFTAGRRARTSHER